MISTLHTGGPTKKGTRMLNGRVYGARRGSSSGEYLVIIGCDSTSCIMSSLLLSVN